MDIFEITGYRSGISREGVNHLEPSDSFSDIVNGFIHRQVLQSRRGISLFAPRLAGGTRITGIFEYVKSDDNKELLVTDLNFLYRFNQGTGIFDQIAFGGSMAGYGGFGITDNKQYISGTAYPDKDNNGRFVFTSSGINTFSAGSAIFFYNGTFVLNYTNTAATDNPDFEQPPGLTLFRAKHVIRFGERINFIVPEYTSTTQNQGILFSAIRAASGNGEKFNASGSGEIILDTSEAIKGASILGQYMALNLQRSSWTLEKTKDPFNPYFPRKIPSVIGTDASFSFTQWADQVFTLGKTGVISMDSQKSKREGNKIPNFTRDEIDPNRFELTYGGFDRYNSQFLWSYLEQGSDIKTQQGSDITTQNRVLVHNYEEDSWSVYNLSLTVFGQTDLGEELTWDDIEKTAVHPSWDRWDTTEEFWNEIGVTAAKQKTLAGDDAGFVYQLNQDFDDYFEDITVITQATSALLTIDASNFAIGDFVVVENVVGMTEINNFDPATGDQLSPAYEVLAATATSITLNIDSTLFTAYVSGGTLSKLIPFSVKTNPFNPYRDDGKKCFISMVEFLINTDGGQLFVDVFVDEEQAPIKQNVLIEPFDTRKKTNWVSMSIDHEADFFTFALRHNSPASGIKITSTRIHAMAGGMTSG